MITDTPRTEIYVLSPLPEIVPAAFARELERENVKLKLEIAAAKSKLAEVVSIARQGRYTAMDFVAVGKRLDAMDDYLANVPHHLSLLAFGIPPAREADQQEACRKSRRDRD